MGRRRDVQIVNEASFRSVGLPTAYISATCPVTDTDGRSKNVSIPSSGPDPSHTATPCVDHCLALALTTDRSDQWPIGTYYLVYSIFKVKHSPGAAAKRFTLSRWGKVDSCTVMIAY